MAQEIERARALLSALIRDKVLAADEATKSYEAWVSSGDESPFSRFVVDLFPNRGEAVRAVLRADAVRGLPTPQAFTFERFEDLLVGQLGIEAGLLSPRLLQTVRAVQDKKVTEGKLRRLDDLLVRAKFEPKMVETLYSHLRERVLICKGCLSRFPRQELGAFAIECPRCDYNMLADALEPSDVKLLPEDQRAALMASSEAVLETVSIQDRLQRRSDRARDTKNPAAILVGLVAVLAVIGGVLVILLGRDKKVVVPITKTKKSPRKTEGPEGKTGEDPDETDGGPKEGMTITEVRGKDLELYKQGQFSELLALWSQVKPQADEDKAQVARDRDGRVKRLEFLVECATQTRALAAKIQDGEARAQEEELARLLAPNEIPRNIPPFLEAYELLAAKRQQRTKAQETRAQERLNAAHSRVTSDSWARRLQRAQERSLRGVEVAGVKTEVSVLALNDRGFTLKTPDGKEYELTWDDEPQLGLAILQASVDPEVASDQIELARAALLAREPVTARQALERAGASLPVDELIAQAPWSALALPAGKDAYRISYPTSWIPSDLVPGPGSKLSVAGDALVLAGTPCVLETAPLPLLSPNRKASEFVPAFAASAEFEEAVPGLHFGVKVVARGGTSKIYSVRWGGGEWRLELGRNLLQRGSLPPSGGRKVRISFDGTELSLLFDGLPVATKATSARLNELSLVLGASEDLKIRSLSIEGPLDPDRLGRGEAAYQERVAREIDALPLAGKGGPFAFPTLSGEDPQAMALASAAVLEGIAQAKEKILAEDYEGAQGLLAQLSRAEGAKFAPTWYYLAFVELLRGETALALRAAGEALSVDPSLIEARGLRALALARGLRLDAAEREAAAAVEVRPDLGTAYLARARIQIAKADLKEAAQKSILGDSVRLAQALSPGDPLVTRDARALIDLERLFRQAKVRVSGDYQHVLSRGSEEDALRLSKLLDKAGDVIEKQMRGVPEGPRLVVLVVPTDYGRLTKDSGTPAYYAHDLGVLLLPSIPAEETREMVLAVASAHVAHRVGPAPAWLEFGLQEHFASKVLKERNQATLRLLKDNRQAPQSDWEELLAAPRSLLQGNKLGLARAWALVDLLGSRVRIDLSKDIAAGQAVPAVPQEVQVEKLAKEYLRWVKSQRLQK